MTTRGAALLLVCAPVIAAGAAVDTLYVLGLALLGAFAVLIVVDGRRAPRRRHIDVHREHDEMLSVGAANQVVLRVQARRRARALVRDECPGRARPSVTAWRADIPTELAYTVTPRSRGELAFGHTVVRAHGPWGFGWRQMTLGNPETVPVEANLAAVRVYEALARRGQLAELGVRTLRLRTEGTEFERVREAVPDDSLRSINWKATARTGRLMATELMPERAQPVIVCLDHGRLMGVGAGDLAKLDHAINAALLLVHVALRSGDRAGLLGFADTVSVALAPRAGPAQLRRFLDAVRPLRAGETEADYDSAFEYFSRWQTRRALVIVFTDVLDPEQGRALLRQCVRLRRRHLPLVVTVRDPAIDDAARRRPASGADAYARVVASGLIADREDTLQLLRRSGIDTIDADARTLSPRLVNRYLALKRQARL
ncbi:MAG TPA: DUF58 domain-containing protein [Candidatus Acidoferrales bacterium]|nr:DUF58 domain-containing protein [Candidatus Acidoferrales bacterium]